MRYDVPLFSQTENMSCWVASIAMILGWRDSACYDEAALARNVGGLDYSPMMLAGLDPNDKYILQRNGFALEYPQCYMQQGVQWLLHQHGPLWVASAVPTAHIRVVTGMVGHQVFVNDPGPVGQGSQYIATFDHFFGQMEQLGSNELAEPDPVYVAYLR